MDKAKEALEQGAKYPFEANDKWWSGGGGSPPPAKDWAHAAARGILVDLQDRRGIKYSFVGIDEECRVEIVESLAEIIRRAAP